MATLVTGGAGFVGANIVKELAKAGHEVVCFDLSGPDQLLKDFIEEHSTGVSFAQGDILDQEAVERLGAEFRIDKIVHAAVFTVNRVELETQRSRDIIHINIGGTANLLELARKQHVDRFIYVSSGAVYGGASPPDQTLNEEVAPVPQNLYGITKYASELLTRRYGELHQFSSASVRLSTPYGPMERVTGHRDVMSPFYRWTGQAVRGEAIQPEHWTGQAVRGEAFNPNIGPGKRSGRRPFNPRGWTKDGTTPTLPTSPTESARCWTLRFFPTTSTTSRRESG